MKAAGAVSFDPKFAYFENRRQLEVLASLDPTAAEPILRKLEAGSSPQLIALAKVARFQAASKKSAAGSRLRAELLALARDSKAAPTARALAFEALLSTPSQDRDALFLALTSDPGTLMLGEANSVRLPLLDALESDPDHWVPILAPLVASTDPATRDNAVFLLSDIGRADAIRPLLPWLSDPGWSSADKLLEKRGDVSRVTSRWSSSLHSRRTSLLHRLGGSDLPESVPGLLKVLETASGQDLGLAASAVARYREPKAVPLLRAAYPRAGTWDGHYVLEALETLGGLEPEWVVRMMEEPPPQGDLSAFEADASRWFGQRRDLPEAIVDRVLARARELEATKPEVSKRLRETAAGWSAALVGGELLDGLAAGNLSLEEARALVVREPASVSPEALQRAVLSGGVAAGVAAVLSQSVPRLSAVLSGTDVQAIRAALAAARLARAPLDLRLVATLLQPADANVGKAARRYLEAEDSREARRILREAHPDQFLVLGARGTWDPGHFSFEQMDATQAPLAHELRQPGGPDAAFGLSFGGCWASQGEITVRLRGDRGELVYRKDPAVFGRRALTAAELARLRRFIAEEHVEDLAPLTTEVDDGLQVEFFWLDRTGGYRVFMNNPGIAEGNSSVYARLSRMFFRLAGDAPLEMVFGVSRTVPGVRLLAEPKSLREPEIEAVWANGRDVRVAVQERFEGSRRPVRSWHAFSGGEARAAAERPEAYPPPLPPCHHDDPSSPPSWMSGTREARVAGDREGLWLCRTGTEPARLAEGWFGAPIVSSDGRWAMAPRTETNWAVPNEVVLVDLSTREVFTPDIPKADDFAPIAFIPTHGKFLVYRGKAHPTQWAVGTAESADAPELYLFDPVTRMSERLSGEVRPLLTQAERPLQPTGRPDEFWAAMPVTTWFDVDKGTVLGRFDSRRFTFTPVATFPIIQFSSSETWIDERTGLVYLSYRGYLLTLPLPK
ncbi:MAG: hypothetical protein QM765_44855 [Myxococcales bacterium]